MCVRIMTQRTHSHARIGTRDRTLWIQISKQKKIQTNEPTFIQIEHEVIFDVDVAAVGLRLQFTGRVRWLRFLW